MEKYCQVYDVNNWKCIITVCEKGPFQFPDGKHNISLSNVVQNWPQTSCQGNRCSQPHRQESHFPINELCPYPTLLPKAHLDKHTSTHSVCSVFHLQVAVYPLCLIRNKHFCMLHINHCLWFIDCFCMLKDDVCHFFSMVKYFLVSQFKAEVCQGQGQVWKCKFGFPKHIVCSQLAFSYSFFSHHFCLLTKILFKFKGCSHQG